MCDPTIINDAILITPLLGDHKLITFTYKGAPQPPIIIYKRNWQNYTPGKLIESLTKAIFEIEADGLQDIWNRFESLLMPIIDDLAPLSPFMENITLKSNYQMKMKPKQKFVKSFEKY